MKVKTVGELLDFLMNSGITNDNNTPITIFDDNEGEYFNEINIEWDEFIDSIVISGSN